MNKEDFWNALREPQERRCTNCKYFKIEDKKGMLGYNLQRQLFSYPCNCCQNHHPKLICWKWDQKTDD